MIDQVAKYNFCGLQSEYVGSAQTSLHSIKSILSGNVQLAYITPESIFENCTYRNMSRVTAQSLSTNPALGIHT